MVKQLVHPDWVRRMNLFGETTGDPARMVSLDADEMLPRHARTTGLDDVGRGGLARVGGDVPPASSIRSNASRSCTWSAG